MLTIDPTGAVLADTMTISSIKFGRLKLAVAAPLMAGTAASSSPTTAHFPSGNACARARARAPARRACGPARACREHRIPAHDLAFQPILVPNPTAQPAAAQAKTTSQTRAASYAQTIEASAERSQGHLLGAHGPHHHSPRQSPRSA